MKKIVLLLMTCYAINMADAQITYGPKLGINSFNHSLNLSDSVSGGAEYHSSSKIAYQFGGVVNFQIIKNFSIRPEIVFEQIAVKYTATNSAAGLVSAHAEQDAKFNYLSIPVNFVGMIDAGPGKINVFAGPQFSFGLGGKAKSIETVSMPFFGNQTIESTYKMKPGKDNGSQTSDDSYYNPINISMNIGAGYQYKRFLFSGQYNIGFTNLTAHSSHSAIEDQRKDEVIKSHGFTFALTYFFGALEK